MFNNTYNKTIVSNHVNAVSGNITKTYAKSFFKRFHLQSELANRLLSSSPNLPIDGEYSRTPVQIVQMMVCGDMEVIAEIITQSDYDEILNK